MGNYKVPYFRRCGKKPRVIAMHDKERFAHHAQHPISPEDFFLGTKLGTRASNLPQDVPGFMSVIGLSVFHSVTAVPSIGKSATSMTTKPILRSFIRSS